MLSYTIEVVGRGLVCIRIKIFSVEPLLVYLKLLVALLFSNASGLLEVHANSASALGLSRSITEDVLLHLVCVDALGHRPVPFTIVTIEAGLDLAFFLCARSCTKSITENVLTLDGRDVALVAWHAVDHFRIVLLLAARGLRQGVGLTILPDLRRLITSVSGHVLSRCGAVLHLVLASSSSNNFNYNSP